MKIKELRQIIREEIKSVLSENQPSPATKPRETPGREVADPETKPGKEEPRRRVGDPGKMPEKIPVKAKTKATIKEADIISKITQRFKTLKKKNPLSEIEVKDPTLLEKVRKAIEDYVKAEDITKRGWDVTGNQDPEKVKAGEIKSKAMKIIKDSGIPEKQIQQEFSEIRKKLKKLKKK